VNIKMNNSVGNILQSKFCACCYILLSRTRHKNQCTHAHLRRGYATFRYRCRNPVMGWRLGGPEARLKKGPLWWRHHTQPTVISTFDQA